MEPMPFLSNIPRTAFICFIAMVFMVAQVRAGEDLKLKMLTLNLQKAVECPSRETLDKANQTAGEVIDAYNNESEKGNVISSEFRKAYRISNEMRGLIRSILTFKKQKPTEKTTQNSALDYIRKVEETIKECKELKIISSELSIS